MRFYVVRLGSMSGDGAYVAARTDDTWTITFDQKLAARMTRMTADFVACEFGDARYVRLRTTSPQPVKP